MESRSRAAVSVTESFSDGDAGPEPESVPEPIAKPEGVADCRRKCHAYGRWWWRRRWWRHAYPDSDPWRRHSLANGCARSTKPDRFTRIAGAEHHAEQTIAVAITVTDPDGTADRDTDAAPVAHAHAKRDGFLKN